MITKEISMAKQMTCALTIAAAVLAVSTSGMAAVMPVPATTQLAPATAELNRNLDAKSLKAGDQITAKLTRSVHLESGVQLQRNTLLLGHVDRVAGTSELVLTFDKAQLKDGKLIPVKATLVGFSPMGIVDYLPLQITAESTVEQRPGIIPVSLYSAVQSEVSGTLTTTKADLRLSQGTQLYLAVAPRPEIASAANGN